MRGWDASRGVKGSPTAFLQPVRLLLLFLMLANRAFLRYSISMSSTQVISRERVRNHGEVYTGEREVQAMLDLVKHQTERIESLFLEPACGTGNFLLPIAERKLEQVGRRYGKSQVEYERMAAIALGSLYGVELLPDNTEICRGRLFDLFDEHYTKRYKKRAKDKMRDSISFILSRNIVVGDALSLKTVGKHPEPIVFSHWSLVVDSKIKRHDYTFEELIPNDESDRTLFAALGVTDTNEPSFIPRSVKEYPLTHVYNLPHADTY